MKMTLIQIAQQLDRIQRDAATLSEAVLKHIPDSPGPATIESVYGKPLSELKPPAGYCWKLDAEGKVEFRPVEEGAWWLCLPERIAMYANTPWMKSPQPMLILRKCKRLVFDIIDEGRTVSLGERFWDTSLKYMSRAEIQIVKTDKLILSEPRVEESTPHA